MSKVIINSHADFEQYEGKLIGTSDYVQISQEQINKFADATNDHQWIHTDPARAKAESPFGTTIAHGFLTVSLLPYLWDMIVDVRNTKATINYGIDKFKFGAAVKVDSRVRIHVSLGALANLRGITKLQLKVKMEIENEAKAAYDGTMTFLYHFK